MSLSSRNVSSSKLVCINGHLKRSNRSGLKRLSCSRRLKREKMLIEPAKEWHFYRLIDGPQGRGYKKL